MRALLILFFIAITSVHAGPPKIYSSDGKYLGDLSSNQYDPNSVSNPYGKYGSQYEMDSINNPYGRYGSPYSNESVRNPYTRGNSSYDYDDFDSGW